ncbi:hypothetical protein BGZ76_011102 [Entomortierella beljakovae]|nr:hypothetical protein BGZ76_011102 [Entomortierella beljakovae]
MHEWKKLLTSVSDSVKHSCGLFTEILSNLPIDGKDYLVESLKFYKKHPVALKTEILCGLSIAIMQVPESVAFAFVARISPSRGLHSTFFIGLFGGLFTSLPGMVSGIAGGMVAIVSEITSDHGPLKDKCISERVEYAYATMIICAALQLIMGFFGVSRLIKLVPHAVMIGFMNGLSIIIFKAQLSAFQTDTIDTPVVDNLYCPPMDYTPPSSQRWLRVDEKETWLVLLVVGLSMAITVFQPKIKKRMKIWKLVISKDTIPPVLTTMIVTTLIGNLLYNKVGVHIRLIGDVAKFGGSLPIAHIPDVPWTSGDFWSVGFRYGFLLALIGSIESVMTWQLCQGILKTNLHTDLSNWEMISQGIGNMFSSFFSSIGGSVMVGQTTVNFISGARGRLSTTIASFTILIFVSVAGKIIEMLPVATLTGILFVVVIHTFHWKTFLYITRLSIPITDIVCIILVTVLAVMTDLAIAVIAGMCWSSLVFAWKAATHTQMMNIEESQIHGKIRSLVEEEMNMIIFKVSGSVFFGSTSDLIYYFSSHSIAEFDAVVIDFDKAILYDSSAVDFLSYVHNEVITKDNKTLLISGLNNYSLNIVKKSHKLRDVIVDMDNTEIHAVQVQS